MVLPAWCCRAKPVSINEQKLAPPTTSLLEEAVRVRLRFPRRKADVLTELETANDTQRAGGEQVLTQGYATSPP